MGASRYFWRDLLINTCLAIGFIALSLWHPLVAAALLSCALIYILVVEWPAFHRWGLALFYPTLPFLFLAGGSIDSDFYKLALFSCVLGWTRDGACTILEHFFDTQRPWVQQKTRQRVAWWLSLLICFLFVFVVGRLWTFYGIFSRPLQEGIFLLIAFATAVFGLHLTCSAGSAFLSRLKRETHLTSTGSFLGTTTGLLDRFGSVLFLIPFILCYSFVLVMAMLMLFPLLPVAFTR